MSLARLIATQRERNGWSLKDLVERAASRGFTTSKGQWSNWIQQKNRPQDPDSLLAVAAGIGVDPAVVHAALGVQLGVSPPWLISAVAELMAVQARGGAVHFAEQDITEDQLTTALRRAHRAIGRRQAAAQRSTADRPRGTVPGPARAADDDCETPSARQP